jgi:hypothetical protein
MEVPVVMPPMGDAAGELVMSRWFKTVLVSLRGRRAGVKIGLVARRRRMPAWSLRP